MKDWTDEPIDFKAWKRVPGNPFADYDPKEGIALWSLWEMPSSSIGTLVRRGRPRGEPTIVRSIRLPAATWKRLEAEARRARTSVNALVARRVQANAPARTPTKRRNRRARPTRASP